MAVNALLIIGLFYKNLLAKVAPHSPLVSSIFGRPQLDLQQQSLSHFSSLVFSFCVLLQAITFAIFEHVLYTDKHYAIYPFYLILFTSALGIYFSYIFAQHQFISHFTYVLLLSIFSSKCLIAYLQPDVGPFALPVAVLFTFSLLYPFFQRPTPFSNGRAYRHFVAVGVCCILVRFTFLPAILEMIFSLSFNGSFLFGAALTLWGLASIPLTCILLRKHMKDARKALALQKFSIVFVLVGMQIMIISLNVISSTTSPPAPSTFQTNTFSSQQPTVDEPLQPIHWLAPSIILLMVGSGRVLNAFGDAKRRPRWILAFLELCSLFAGSFVLGFFIAKTNLESGGSIDFNTPGMLPTRMNVVAVLVSLALFCVLACARFMLFPIMRSHTVFVYLYAAFVLFSSTTFLFGNLLYVDVLGQWSIHRLFDFRSFVLVLSAAGHFIIALISQQTATTGRQLKATAHNQAVASAAAQHSHTNRWKARIGNCSTLLTYCLAILINVHYLGGSETCVFFLFPLLFLFNPEHSHMWAQLAQKSRYFPMLLLLIIALIVQSAYRITFAPLLFYTGFSNDPSALSLGVFGALKELILVLFTMPEHYLFALFIMTFHKQGTGKQLMMIPINIAIAFFSSLWSTQLLAGMAVLFAILHFLFVRSIQTRSKSVL